MGKIKKLDQITANSIAAGEVVERPASVVKELCENALDAGASIISIETTGGGIKSILITDNGIGMDSDDALESFERHATSKLSQIEDLDYIQSMGFRGEALAAISAVSRITLKTKTAAATHGTKVYIEGGELLEHIPQACQEGTSFLIEDLFFNTPARYKFLKKDTTEAAKITEIVQRLALARPDVSFRLSHNDKKILHTPGNNDLKSTIYALFGKTYAQGSVYLAETKAADGTAISMEAALGLPLNARRNRNNQFFYVNNRLVKSPILTRALEEAYSGLLMHGQYPFAILKISAPQNLLDINVHPQKMELRFWNEQAVFSAVYHLVKEALVVGMRHPDDEIKEERLEKPASVAPEVNQADKPVQYVPQSLPEIKDSAVFRWNTSPVQYPDTNASEQITELAENREKTVFVSQSDSMLEALAKAQFVGQLFRTYLIFESQDEFYLIDQHAAHEKILYEQIISDINSEQQISQVCLLPETMKLSAIEMAALDENSAFIASLGFEIDLFSEKEIIIRAVPASLANAEAQAAFSAALDQLTEEESNLGLKANREQIRLGFATKACKAAVKAHDALSKAEVNALLEQLLKLDNPYQCPHGRPVILRKTRYELEKQFKRIV